MAQRFVGAKNAPADPEQLYRTRGDAPAGGLGQHIPRAFSRAKSPLVALKQQRYNEEARDDDASPAGFATEGQPDYMCQTETAARRQFSAAVAMLGA